MTHTERSNAQWVEDGRMEEGRGRREEGEVEVGGVRASDFATRSSLPAREAPHADRRKSALLKHGDAVSNSAMYRCIPKIGHNPCKAILRLLERKSETQKRGGLAAMPALPCAAGAVLSLASELRTGFGRRGRRLRSLSELRRATATASCRCFRLCSKVLLSGRRVMRWPGCLVPGTDHPLSRRTYPPTSAITRQIPHSIQWIQ